MDLEQSHHRSQLFMLRMWPEAANEGEIEWRGKVQHVSSGETRYFRNWATLVTFLQETLAALEDAGGSSERE